MVYSLEEAPKGALPQKPQSLERPAKKNSNSPKNMGGEIREWAVRSNDEPGPAKEEKAAPGQVAYASVILGRPSLLEKSKIRSQFISNRYPWEGFPNVGFRCIVEVGIK
jgi:formylglycine-generating enzyme required for sulfatase activity